MDIVNATLTVAEVTDIEWPGGTSCTHIMEPAPCFHFISSTLVDDSGNEYPMDIYGGHDTKNCPEGYIRRHIELPDNIRIPVGTVLHFKKPEWKKDIPKSNIKTLSYSTECIDVGEFFSGIYASHPECDLVVHENGIVSAKEYDWDTRRIIKRFHGNVGKTETKKFFHEILECVSGNDFYAESYCDDRSRTFTLQFESGEKLTYPEPLTNGDLNSDTVFREFFDSLTLKSVDP